MSGDNGRNSYVFFGSVAWDSPWLTDQNLAYALAGHSDVLYIEPPITPLTPFRYGVRAETGAELRALARRGPRDEGRLRVFRPLALPRKSQAWSRAASAPFVRRQIRRAVRQAGLARPVGIAARAMLDIAGAAGERALVYLVKDWVAAGADLLGRDAAVLAAERDAMCDAAALVCATSPRLRDALEARGTPSMLLRHGFHADLADRYESAEQPPEYLELPRPLLGYAGRIDGRLAFDALRDLSEQYPDASIVLVGPVSPRLGRDELAAVVDRPNVHLIGERDRESLPPYIAWLDCCLLPYRESEWLAHASPLKLWDYLYAGPPIAASGCLALEDYAAPLIFFSRNPAGLPQAVAAALADGRDAAEGRRALALRNSWDARAAEIEAELRDLVH